MSLFLSLQGYLTMRNKSTNLTSKPCLKHYGKCVQMTSLWYFEFFSILSNSKAEAGFPCHQSTCPVHWWVCHEIPSFHRQERGMDEVLNLLSPDPQQHIPKSLLVTVLIGNQQVCKLLNTLIKVQPQERCRNRREEQGSVYVCLCLREKEREDTPSQETPLYNLPKPLLLRCLAGCHGNWTTDGLGAIVQSEPVRDGGKAGLSPAPHNCVCAFTYECPENHPQFHVELNILLHFTFLYALIHCY